MKICIDAVKSRRSVQCFDQTKDVSKDVLNEILMLANLSPSSLNLQPWEVVIVNDRDKKGF